MGTKQLNLVGIFFFKEKNRKEVKEGITSPIHPQIILQRVFGKKKKKKIQELDLLNTKVFSWVHQKMWTPETMFSDKFV